MRRTQNPDPVLGGRLATLRWPQKLRLVVIASTTFSEDSLCLLLLGRLKLSQLTQATGERLQELILTRWGGWLTRTTGGKSYSLTVTHPNNTRLWTRKIRL